MKRIPYQILTLLATLLLTISLLCGCNSQDSRQMESTPLDISSDTPSANSKAQNKHVGSKNTPGLFMDMEIFKNADEIVAQSPLIVIASFSEDPTVVEETTQIGDVLYASHYKLQVEQILKGSCEETILFSQFGKPDSDDYETKIKKDQKYLLFLMQKPIDSNQPIYDAVGLEQGILEIQANDTLYCYYDDGVMPTFDGKPADILLEQVRSYTE